MTNSERKRRAVSIKSNLFLIENQVSNLRIDIGGRSKPGAGELAICFARLREASAFLDMFIQELELSENTEKSDTIKSINQ